MNLMRATKLLVPGVLEPAFQFVPLVHEGREEV